MDGLLRATHSFYSDHDEGSIVLVNPKRVIEGGYVDMSSKALLITSKANVTMVAFHRKGSEQQAYSDEQKRITEENAATQ